jgi:hypothetical protein
MISVAVPFQNSAYERRFDAEIDVLPDSQILVRGRMSDHRFEFEHSWRVRTPEYVILEARARQIAGEKAGFDPLLCDRYPAIDQTSIGRGFTKRVIDAFGKQPGAQEHLFLALEMARVAQQIYQVPAELEAKFATGPGAVQTGLAHQFWSKDRAYMPGLANSCYTYRDESESLFLSREVRPGFEAEIYNPQPGERRAFWRSKQLSISALENEPDNRKFACANVMEDRIHDIRVAFDLAEDGVVSNARSEGVRLPYHGVCEDAQMRTPGLNGMRVTADYLRLFADSVGGSQGCSHLFDLSVDLLRLFRWA